MRLDISRLVPHFIRLRLHAGRILLGSRFLRQVRLVCLLLDMNALKLPEIGVCRQSLANLVGKGVPDHISGDELSADRSAPSVDEGNDRAAATVNDDILKFILLVSKVKHVLVALLILEEPLHPDELTIDAQFGSFHAGNGRALHGHFLVTCIVDDRGLLSPLPRRCASAFLFL